MKTRPYITSLMGVILSLTFTVFHSCGQFESESSNAVVDTSHTVTVSVSIDTDRGSFNLVDGEEEEEGFGLIDLSTIYLKITGCSSGYSQTFLSTSSVQLYKNDQNCLAKVVSFIHNGETYQVLTGNTLDPTGDSFDPVVNHLTPFRSTTNTSHIIYIQVITPLPSTIASSATVQFSLFALNIGTSLPVNVANNIIRLSSTSSSIDTNQAAQTLTYTVKRVTQPNSNPLVVNYTLAGNAVAGTDYTQPSGSVIFAANETSKAINITVASKTGILNHPKTIEFKIGNGNYFSYATDIYTTLTNSSSAEPSSNLAFKYDSSSITSSSGTISSWNDLSSNAINATQGTSSNKPSLTTGSGLVKSVNAVSFDGTSDYLEVPSHSNVNSGTTGYTGKTVTIALITPSDVSRTQVLYSQGDDKTGMLIYIRSGAIYSVTTKNKNFNSSVSSGAVSANTFYIYSMAFDSTAGTLRSYLSGTLMNTTTGVQFMSNSTNSNTIGGSNSSAKLDDGTSISDLSSSNCMNNQPCFFGGTMLEFYYFNASLADSVIKGHHSFLSNKLLKGTVNIQKTSSSAITELSGTVSRAFQVLLQSPSATDTVISYTVDGSSTAAAGTDYVALSGSVTIAAGYTSAYIPLTTLYNSGSSSSKTLRLNLSNSSSYTLGSSTNATITIADTSYTPPNLLAWFNVPQNQILNTTNLVTTWNDVASNADCTHPISAYQSGDSLIPTYRSSTLGVQFDTLSYFKVDSNACMDNITSTQQSFGFVFQTGSDITTNQVIYEHGSSTVGQSLSISNGDLVYTAYDTGWNRYVNRPIAANTLYAVILEYKASSNLRMQVSSGLGTGTVTWDLASSASAAGTSITASSNNGIGIGGIRSGAMFYSLNTNGNVSISNANSGVNLFQNGMLYELIVMNNTIYTTGGTTLTNFQNYLANKYNR